MVKESWFSSLWRSSRRNLTETDKSVVGVLTFEVGSLMSKVVHIWNCLRDEQVVRMREEIINSVGIRKLVSDDEEYLVRLICAETMENLGVVTRSVAMLGKRCTDPVLQRLENVFDDLVSNYSDLFGWEFSVRKMEKKVKKMEKFVGASGGLYHEMEVLADLEQVLKRIQASAHSYSNSNPAANSGTRSEIQKKVVLQRQEVKHLRDISLWNKSFDYVVRLLVQSIFTIFRRIRVVFWLHEEDNSQFQTSMTTDSLPRSHSVSASSQSSSVHPSESSLPRFASGPLRRPVARSGPFGRQGTMSGPINGTHEMSYNMPGNINAKPPRLKGSKLGSSGPFKGCIMGGGGTRSPVINGYPKSYGGYSGVIRRAKDSYPEPVVQKSLRSNLISLSSKCTQLIAPSSTLGGAALALHYANVIIVIEKLVHSPHLIGPDARDDLYSMLPQNIRAMLRERLMLYVKKASSSSFCDTDLATEWSGALTRILEWLAPLAHNMIRWQSERNFQQQHLISRTNVLLVQTLYFANQAKTEGAVTELLVGLNYLWRFGRELNEKALMECASSGEFDDYLDYN